MGWRKFYLLFPLAFAVQEIDLVVAEFFYMYTPYSIEMFKVLLDCNPREVEVFCNLVNGCAVLIFNQSFFNIPAVFVLIVDNFRHAIYYVDELIYLVFL